jgi:hypothetical protein
MPFRASSSTAGSGCSSQDYARLHATALLVRRFDRVDGARIPFLSAMSLLDARDGETRSYLEIADALRGHGAAPAEDLRELWSRIVFTVLVSNTEPPRDRGGRSFRRMHTPPPPYE